MVKIGFPFQGKMVGIEIPPSVAKAWGLGAIRAWYVMLLLGIVYFLVIVGLIWWVFK